MYVDCSVDVFILRGFTTVYWRTWLGEGDELVYGSCFGSLIKFLEFPFWVSSLRSPFRGVLTIVLWLFNMATCLLLLLSYRPLWILFVFYNKTWWYFLIIIIILVLNTPISTLDSFHDYFYILTSIKAAWRCMLMTCCKNLRGPEIKGILRD